MKWKKKKKEFETDEFFGSTQSNQNIEPNIWREKKTCSKPSKNPVVFEDLFEIVYVFECCLIWDCVKFDHQCKTNIIISGLYKNYHKNIKSNSEL